MEQQTATGMGIATEFYVANSGKKCQVSAFLSNPGTRHEQRVVKGYGGAEKALMKSHWV